MSSSFDEEAGGKPGKKSPLLPGSRSRSQPSVTEISCVYIHSKDASSSDDGSKNPGTATATATTTTTTTTKAKAKAKAKARYQRNASRLSVESEIWGEGDADEDPAGELIAAMLNDRPHFGYPPIEAAPPASDAHLRPSFPLFTARNCRAARSWLSGVWKGAIRRRGRAAEDLRAQGRRRRRALRFLLEALAVCYVVVYSLNDAVLRSLTEWLLFLACSAVSTLLFDPEEVRRAAAPLVGVAARRLSRRATGLRAVLAIVERELLWGSRFRGRTFLWSDAERLVRFRRKHRRLLGTNSELRQRSRKRRAAKWRRRRRRKEEGGLDPRETEPMGREDDDDETALEQLQAAARELARRPPTLFPDRVREDHSGPDVPRRAPATKRHLDALRFCHDMIFVERGEQELRTSVRIQAVNDKPESACRQTLSPKEAIEVEFPDIGANINLDASAGLDGSINSSFSGSQSLGYRYHDSDSSSEEEDDATLEEGSYASESTQNMPWAVVGAKIGHKLLTARKLHRVIANPDAASGAASKLLPDEARNFIKGIHVSREEGAPLPSAASSSRDAPPPLARDDVAIPPVAPGGASASLAPTDLAPPVHGLLTSAGAAARTPSSYGAIVLEPSPTGGAAEGGHNAATANPFPRHGRRTPPGAQQPPELQMRGESASSGYRTPLKLIQQMPTSPPRHNGLQGLALATPQTSNLSQKVFHFNDAQRENKSPVSIPVTRLAPLEKGVKMVVPMFPPNCRTSAAASCGSCYYQMVGSFSHFVSFRSCTHN